MGMSYIEIMSGERKVNKSDRHSESNDIKVFQLCIRKSPNFELDLLQRWETVK